MSFFQRWVTAGLSVAISAGFYSLALAAPTIGTVSVRPSVVSINTSTTVTFSASIPDPALVKDSVQLLRITGFGRPPAVIGRMYDDGTHGDASAGDGVFTLDVVMSEPVAAEAGFAVTARFAGTSARVLSGQAIVSIWPVVTDAVTGVTVNRPPTWKVQASPPIDTFRISNVDAFLRAAGALENESLFQVRRSRSVNPSQLPVGDWFDQAFPAGSTDPLVGRSVMTVSGRPSLRTESEDIGRTVHVYVPVGIDIVEIAYDLRNASFVALYEKMLSSLQIKASGTSAARLQVWPRVAAQLRAMWMPIAANRYNWKDQGLPWLRGLFRYQGASGGGTAPADLVAIARLLVGQAYKKGALGIGDGPLDQNGNATNLWDCNALMRYLYPDLPRGSANQGNFDKGLEPKITGSLADLIANGTLQSGDLLFFDTSNAQDGIVHHVGIYDGNGHMINAFNEKYGVDNSDLSSELGGYWEKSGFNDKGGPNGNFLFARRHKKPDQTLTLTVTVAGDKGRVQSFPAGINCSAPGNCTAEFPIGATVNLAAFADSGSELSKWDGACTGDTSCSVKLDVARAVTATFDAACTICTFTTSQIVAVDHEGFGWTQTYTMTDVIMRLQKPKRIDFTVNVLDVADDPSNPYSPAIVGPSFCSVSLTGTNGSLSGSMFGACIGANLEWLVTAAMTAVKQEGAPDQTTVVGTLRIHNLFVPPWTSPGYGEDTGPVGFTLK